MATRTPGAPRLSAPPYPPEFAAEYIGTVLVNHFINRMMEALRPQPLLPSNRMLAGLARRAAGIVMARTVRRDRRAGASLRLLAGRATQASPEWAGDTPIGTAFAALHAAANDGGALLSDAARIAVAIGVAKCGTAHPPMARGWLDEPLAALPVEDQPGAKLALLAALAPYRITDADVAEWRTSNSADADLVRLLAFGAITAVDLIAVPLSLPSRAI
jgi:hypothetical protein